MSSKARTVREAIAAEILEDVDKILLRAEALPEKIEAVAQRIEATAGAVDAAGEKYRDAVGAFTQEAKATLTAHMERKGAEITARTVEEQRAALQDIVLSIVDAQRAANAAPPPAQASRTMIAIAAGGWVATLALIVSHYL